MSKTQSPCKTCTRVKNPMICGNMTCPDWRDWFLKAWECACDRLRPPGENEKED